MTCKMLYQLQEGALWGWLTDLCTDTGRRNCFQANTQVTEADKEPEPGTPLFAVIEIMCQSLQICVLVQRVTLSHNTFRV